MANDFEVGTRVRPEKAVVRREIARSRDVPGLRSPPTTGVPPVIVRFASFPTVW